MTEQFARRTVIAGLGAGLVPALASPAPAQQRPQVLDRGSVVPEKIRTLEMETIRRAVAAAQIEASEYSVKKGEISLYLYRKRAARKPGDAQKPVLFLVHGSSNSSRTSYDLVVPGKDEYSAMNVYASYGFDVWTMDHDGYGRSGWSGGNSDIASGVADLKAAIPLVLRESGAEKVHMYGASSGAIRAGAYAQVQHQFVDRLILAAFTYKGTGSPEIARRAAVNERYRSNPRRTRDAAMIRSIFTRDGHASAYDMAVADAIAEEELKFGDKVPTGTYLDMAVNLPLVDPKKVLAPVLMLRGAHDGNSTNEDLLDFYAQLPNGDRQFVILPHTAHSLGYSNNRHLVWYAVKNFLHAPAAVGA
jgi:alpha-beta hydrolase superfamily lysophospholipase